METPFYDHLSAADFENVYEPAEDSFLLLDALEIDLPYLEEKKPLVCLEIGSGSGVIITALCKKLKPPLCIATDINPYACLATKRTAEHNKEFSIEAINCSLADALRPKTIDVLIFNPPYVVTPEDEVITKQFTAKNTENHLVYSWAGGADGRFTIDKLLLSLNNILSESGVFYLLLLRENKPAEVNEMLSKLGFISTVVIERHVPGERLCVLRITRTK